MSAFAQATLSSPLSFRESSSREPFPFLTLVEPLIRQALHRLQVGIKTLERESVDSVLFGDNVEDLLLINVERQLLTILVPTLVLEVNVARVQGVLEGETRQQRFDSFITRLRRPEIALALLREYPALARQAVLCLDHWVTFSLEFLRRLSADWKELSIAFGTERHPGRIVAISDRKGDQHREGRSVLIVAFSSGFKIVYKPRSLAVAVHFQELLNWLNQHGTEPPLKTIKILARSDYGWVEFISSRGCSSRDEIHRFYKRHGQYLALLYVIAGTDFHYENLIAMGEHPILVDLETLFQPCFGDNDRTINRVYRDSVLRIGLLPQREFGSGQSDGVDLSGLGGAAGQPLPYRVLGMEAPGTDEMRIIQREGESAGCGNQPTLMGTKLDLLDYIEPITSGFEQMYGLLQHNRADLLSQDGPLSCFAEDPIRVVLRPTLTYSQLLRSSLHPDALRDAFNRDMMFATLHWHNPEAAQLKRVLSSEVVDLHNRDIPIFTTSPSSHDLLTSSGQRIPDFFPETGQSLVHRRLRNLGNSDYLRQLWFIRASLATTAKFKRSATLTKQCGRQTRGAATREELLGEARAVGERLAALALSSGENISWLGLTLTKKDNWSLLPLGLDLYNGLPGVAFFLAYLGSVSQEAQFTTLAKTTTATIRRHLASCSVHQFGIGAFDGLGGIIYLFTHLGTLWNDSELLIEAQGLAQSLRSLIFYDRRFDITGGAAGCIMSLLALQSTAPGENVLAAAVECGYHLLQHAQPQRVGTAWSPYFPAKAPLTGLAHGVSGIAWALLELFRVSGDCRFRKAALEAISYENSLFSAERNNWPDLRDMNNGPDGAFMLGWCHGAPGIALARLRGLQCIDSTLIRDNLTAGLQTTLSQGFRGDHSLCHGSLGNLEPLFQASKLFDQTQWTRHIDRASADILQSIYDYGWLCGVPFSVESPGLMTGLAGIGYGLLRVAEPSLIPALLALSPPAQDPRLLDTA